MTILPQIPCPGRWHLPKLEPKCPHCSGVCQLGGIYNTSSVNERVTLCSAGAEQQAESKGQGDLRVLFAAGGTGGHVYPAIAVADEVRRLHPEAKILFVGTKNRMEWVAVPRAGYAISPIPAVALRRPLWSPSNLLLPFRVLYSIVDCWKLIQAFKPHLVVGTGGYVTGPVCLVAALAGFPLVIQEQNAYAGITNRILANFAKVVFLAFAAAVAYFPKEKCRVRGNPTRSALQRKIPKSEAIDFFTQLSGQHGGVVSHNRAPAEDSTTPPPVQKSAEGGFSTPIDERYDRVSGDRLEQGKVVLVLGGSLGAKAINMAVAGMAMDLLAANPGISIIWQTGPRYMGEMVHLVGNHPCLALYPYLDRMDMAYAAADIVVARAGAITCSELLTTAKPSILIPSTNVAEDHQMKNAVALVKAGAAKLLPEKELNPVVLSSLIVETLKDEAALSKMTENATRAATPNAAAVIAEEALSLVRETTYFGGIPSIP